MTPRILAVASPGEVQVAVAEGDALLDFCLWRPGAPDGVGALHRARITARVPALAGSFAALAGSAEGFLPDSEGGEALHEGDVFIARVTRAAQAGKGPRLTARVDATDLAAIPPGKQGLVRHGPDPLARMAAAYPDAPVITDSPALAAQLRARWGERVGWRSGDILGEQIAGQIAALAEPDIALPGGMRMSITPTPALVAIDVDTGAASAGSEAKRRHQMRANLAMLPCLARQIRLRNLSGAILVDFAGLSARARGALGPSLEAALAADPLQPRLLGFTALGLAEILRRRIHPPLHEVLGGPHAAGLAALRRMAAQVSAQPRWRPVLHAAPAVMDSLLADAVAVAEWETLAGRKLVLQCDHALAPLGWRMGGGGDV